MPETDTVLTDPQRARCEALRVAQQVLATRNVVSVGAVDVVDLVTVATWIVTGQDPWQTEP